MITLADTVLKHLEENGIFAEQDRYEILARMKEGGTLTEEEWRKPIDGYPNSIVAVLKVSANTAALKWIDECKPEHFARTMFDGTF